METFTSDPLHTGPRSVIQESALSCILYIIFTMDLPLIYDSRANKAGYEESTNKPKSTSYIDDNFILVRPFEDKTLQQALDFTIEKMEDYMANNKLQLNTQKTQLMVLTKKPARRMEIKIAANPKDIIHSPKVKILGIAIDQLLNWKFFLLDGPLSIAKQLKKRLNSLKLLKNAAT